MSDVLYEQPLNEKIRAFLRLEQLFLLLDDYRQCQRYSDCNNFFATLFTILELIDRPDIKVELVKELELLESQLNQWLDHPDVNTTALQQALAQTSQLNAKLPDTIKRALELRQDPFLASLRSRFTIPLGHFSFDLPNLHYWQHQQSQQQQQIDNWLHHLSQCQQALALVLRFIRQRTDFVPVIAQQGFFQRNAEGISLIRIRVSDELAAYPTVSGNRYRFSIRFMQPCQHQGKQVYNQDLEFQLACC